MPQIVVVILFTYRVVELVELGVGVRPLLMVWIRPVHNRLQLNAVTLGAVQVVESYHLCPANCWACFSI